MASFILMQFKATSTGHVTVIATGGTIASTSDDSGARVPRLDGAELVARSDTQIPTKVIDSTSLDSSSMTLADIDELVGHIRTAFTDPATSGVVVTHGTDSMAETALALDMMLDDDRPVVLTGAQLPADHPRPDGPLNLAGAIELAAGEAPQPGVLIHFGGMTLPARGAFKRHTHELQAFASSSDTPLVRPTPVGAHLLEGTNVVIVTAWPGASGQVVDAIVDTRPDGIVVAALGAGNLSAEMGRALHRPLRAGIPVVISTQVPYGSVAFDYGGAGGGNTLGALGALSAGYLSPGQARIALTVALASGADPAQLLA
ncbi:asparaginase [Corynebacterium sp. S7]